MGERVTGHSAYRATSPLHHLSVIGGQGTVCPQLKTQRIMCCCEEFPREPLWGLHRDQRSPIHCFVYHAVDADPFDGVGHREHWDDRFTGVMHRQGDPFEYGNGCERASRVVNEYHLDVIWKGCKAETDRLVTLASPRHHRYLPRMLRRERILDERKRLRRETVRNNDGEVAPVGEPCDGTDAVRQEWKASELNKRFGLPGTKAFPAARSDEHHTECGEFVRGCKMS